MTIMVAISEAAKAHAEALVLSGRYDSVEEAVEAGLSQLGDWDEVVDLDALSAEHRAAVEEGLAAAEAGDVVDGQTFFRELRAKYRAMTTSK